MKFITVNNKSKAIAKAVVLAGFLLMFSSTIMATNISTPNVWITGYDSSNVTKLNSLTGGAIGTYEVGSVPFGVAVDVSGNVWVANFNGFSVTKLNGSTGATMTYGIGMQAYGIAVDISGNIWVTNVNNSKVTKLNGSTGQIIGTYEVGASPNGIAADASGNIWVVNNGGSSVTKLNGSSGAAIGTYEVGADPVGIAIDASGNVWVTNYSDNTVISLNGSTGMPIGTYEVGGEPQGIAIDSAGNVWVANGADDNVTKLNGITGAAIGTYEVGNGPVGIAVDAQRNIWVANTGNNNITKLNGSTGQIIGAYAVGSNPNSLGDMTGFALQYFVLGYRSVFIITAEAGSNGAVSPSGTTTYESGVSQAFTVVPDSGYRINYVKIDGVSTTETFGATYIYTFESISSNHSIEAAFSINTYKITSEAGSNGTIEPLGTTTKNYGTSQAYVVRPDAGYHINYVKIDGVSTSETFGSTYIYTFESISTNHTIEASFALTSYLITSEAGSNGTVTPSGTASKSYGSSQTYAIAPNTGYHISDVLVDSVSQGITTEYTFSNITANHTISASFEINTYLITSEAGSNGTIEPLGTTAKNYGTSQTYTITPNSGYSVNNVLVDGSSVGAVLTYTFSSIAASHSIEATFSAAILPVNSPEADAFSGVKTTRITANWKANGNPSTFEYYCENTTAGTNSGWITDLSWTSSSLEASTEYTFRVKARNTSTSESGWVSLGKQTTSGYTTPDALISGISLEAGDSISSTPTITISLRSPSASSMSSITPQATLSGVKKVYVDAVEVAYDIISTSDTSITIKIRNAIPVGTHTIKIITYDTAGTEYMVEKTGLTVSSGTVSTSGPTLVYPNPYDPLAGNVKITYNLSVDTGTLIYVFDRSGRLVWKSNYASGSNGGKAGYNEVSWDAVGIFGQLTSDVYFIKIADQATGNLITKTKMVVWKGGVR